jgi:hypothetical protein
MNYTIAWLVILVAGLLGTGFLFLITRGVTSAGLRWSLRLLPLLLMVVPAPVPNYDGQLAPAFVVLIFESLFQADGQPGTAGGILLAAALISVALGILLGRIASRVTTQPVDPEP